MTMKIVHICHSNNSGGAAIAASRIHKGMLKAGLASSFLTLRDLSPLSQGSSFLQRNIYQINARRYLKKNNYELARYDIKGVWSDGLSMNRLALNESVMSADVVYLHWINHGTLSIEEIGRLLDTGKQVVWVMHDMWPITGGCHHSLDCPLYQTHCGKCPVLSSTIEYDPSYRVFERKLKYLSSRKNLTMVSPGRWLADCALKSALFRDNRIEVIPNIIDTNVFKPVDKNFSRDVLNLPKNRKLLLFGCDGGTSNPYKGWKYLEEALHKLDLSECELVVFGQAEDEKIRRTMDNFNTKTHFLGCLMDQRISLPVVYSAVDAFISPSKAESFGLTLGEAEACGTPSVCFDVGGIHDVVIHKETGYCAKLKDVDDLVCAINYVTDEANSARLSANARKHIVDLCSEENVIKRHVTLLDSLIK